MNYSTRCLTVSFFFLLLTLSAYARKPETGFVNRTVSSGGVTHRYQVYVPADWDKHHKWPVLLFLHGYGERGDDGLLSTDIGIGHAIRTHAALFTFLVVIPQCSTSSLWTKSDMQEIALAALEQTIREFKGDRDRLYLSGLSMGGYGTWDMAVRYPGKFAGLAPVCGGIRAPGLPELHASLLDDPKVSDAYAETARRIGRTPVWIFHGDADEAVPVEESRKMAEALRAANANVKYTEYPGVGHNSWDKAYSEPDFVPWLLSQKLQR
jgi:predicted peptidase